MAGRQRIPRPPFNPSTHAFCTHCKQVKSRRDFPKNKNNPNGLHAWCLKCNNAGVTRWENDPANYRRRRDAQALNNRRYRNKMTDAPVRARFMSPPAMRQAGT